MLGPKYTQKFPFLESRPTEIEVVSVGKTRWQGNHQAPRREDWMNPLDPWDYHFPHLWQGKIRPGLKRSRPAAPFGESKSNLAIGEYLPNFLSWFPFNFLLLGHSPSSIRTPSTAPASPLCYLTMEGLTPKMLSDSGRFRQHGDRNLHPTPAPNPSLKSW